MKQQVLSSYDIQNLYQTKKQQKQHQEEKTFPMSMQ
jgi:hypothetical protein